MSVSVRGLKASYGGQAVLDGVDLEVAAGEFVGITGPSGCGKTTLLQIVARLQPPAEGSVKADGRLAVVFQRPTLLPWRTVLDNVAFGLECAGEPSPRTLAAEWLERVGMGASASRWPHELSEGMKQRVSLARAMAVRPRLLLLDEPFSALDSSARWELQDLLLKLWEEERFTALFVSHWLEELSYLADRVVVLSGQPARVAKDARIGEARPRVRAAGLSLG